MRKELPIGKLIHNEMKAQGRTVVWLADKLCCDKSNVHKIFKKTTMDVTLLLQISIILKTDFFTHYSQLFQEWTNSPLSVDKPATK